MYYEDYDDYLDEAEYHSEVDGDSDCSNVTMTWNGPIGPPELYGEPIRSLSRQTESNLDRLRPSLSCSNLHSRQTDNSKMDSMFPTRTSSSLKSGPVTISSVSFDGDFSDMSQPIGFNFCYLCSTLEEHQRNHIHHYPKKPIKARKPRIEYIAPKPRVKKKEPEPESANHEALYRIVVYVGNVPQASSDANVSVTIVGTRDILPKTRLCRGKATKAKFCFVRGAVEKFYVKGPKLGNLRILTIEHDGLEKRHSLYIEKIEVTDMQTDLTWMFMCKNWLSLHFGDYCLRRDLEAQQKERVLKEYEIIVSTGNKRLGGTDANVYITLYGTEKNSHKVHLNRGKTGEHFNRGQSDRFLVSVKDLGVIKSIRVEHDGHGMADGWNLDKIIIRNTANQKEIYYFLYGGWIASDEGDGKLWREIKAKKKLDKILLEGRNTKYKVTVQTGDRQFAGTDANVYIQFVGPKGSTKKLKLDDARNNFERGVKEEFEVTGIDVGELDHIIIGHDNSGPGAGWFLDFVEVEKYFSKSEIRERLAKLRNLHNNKETEDKDEASKYIAMGRRRSSFSRQKAINQSDDDTEERPINKRLERRRSKAEFQEVFDEDGTIIRIPYYQKYWFKCERWLAANEDDGLFQRELKPHDKKIYFKEKN
ncbi:hypothetical protein LOTGIDRAFT_166832 [Lottia gigantea]|uniref:PLAT domain-containing protein n=1 Tax=Lottia gigantea TaxID=225164 RepID=V3Z7M6_LOTGI|nr:hypothetical protein LOTGIDRAFT_166832 [Lottia gigantea]ESO86828.1 hypothetical protein LOTGIDRAFT_166832 [Lottia gigantea]